MKSKTVISHREGDIINIIFVDARKETPKDIQAEGNIEFVTHITIAILIVEDGMNNSKL